MDVLYIIEHSILELFLLHSPGPSESGPPKSICPHRLFSLLYSFLLFLLALPVAQQITQKRHILYLVGRQFHTLASQHTPSLDFPKSYRQQQSTERRIPKRSKFWRRQPQTPVFPNVWRIQNIQQIFLECCSVRLHHAMRHHIDAGRVLQRAVNGLEGSVQFGAVNSGQGIVDDANGVVGIGIAIANRKSKESRSIVIIVLGIVESNCSGRTRRWIVGNCGQDLVGDKMQEWSARICIAKDPGC